MSYQFPEIKVAISGTFKAKDQIDATIIEFEKYGARVLAPERGWTTSAYPNIIISHVRGYHPLPSEVGLTIGGIEDRSLSAVRRADLLYLVDPLGYIGESAGLEIGFASAAEKPIYACEPISRFIETIPQIVESIKVLPVLETLEDFHVRHPN